MSIISTFSRLFSLSNPKVSHIYSLFNNKTEISCFIFGYILHFLFKLFIAVLGLLLQSFIALHYLNNVSIFKQELNLNINDYLKKR